MANRPPFPFVFEDDRDILQGPLIIVRLYTRDPAWLGIDSDDDEQQDEQQQDHPRSPLPHELDGATRVVRLAGMLSPDDLRDDASYEEVLEDITVEVCKFGDLLEVVIPRPGDPAVSRVGKVFLKYACLDDSVRCRTSLDGRWFAGRSIVAGYYPEDRFAAQDYGYDG